MNPLNQPILSLFYHLNTLNGLLFTLDDQLQQFEKLYRDSISKSCLDISMIFSGARLVIRDLTERPKDGWSKYYPSGKFSSKGEEYFELIKALLARESAWTVSQAYEAYETFLKDVSATLLLENQQPEDQKKVLKFESDRKSHNLEKTDISFWRAYLDYHYRTNTERLRLLRKVAPDISKGETENNRSINLTDWFAVVEELRHSATHSNFIIKADRMKNWSKAKREMLKKHFSGNDTGQGYQLAITKKKQHFVLNCFRNTHSKYTNSCRFQEAMIGVF